MSIYDERNGGEGTALRIIESLRNGSYQCPINDSKDVKENYEKMYSYLKKELPNSFSEDRVKGLAILQTEHDRPLLSAFQNSKTDLKSPTPEFEYLAKVSEIENFNENNCKKIKNDNSVFDKIFESGEQIYCEGTLNAMMPPGKNSLYLCKNLFGVLDCIKELKEMGCSFQLYSANEPLRKRSQTNLKFS